MINLLIPNELAEEIINLAQREATSVTDVLTRMVRQYAPSEPVPDAQVEALEAMIGMFDDDVTDMSTTSDADSDSDVPPLGTGARLLYEFDKIGFSSDLTDSVERSREILETEFADYLMSKRYQDG